ncbi:MAG: DUF6476 family protein [Rhodobacteraceae bacterium]|jgi:hypothetical protein|nr:DUF6476 family protein [Paracoccaceae bacterium]
MDDDPPLRPEDARTLRFLRGLVTVLTGTMIVGMAVLVVLFATRFPGAPAAPALPDAITLPAGETARAVTMGTGWVAVVTADDEILILDPVSGALRQRIAIAGQ